MEDLKFWDILDQRIQNPPIPRLRPSVGYHPSSASIKMINEDGEEELHGTCLRKIGYERLGYKATEEVPADAIWKMDIGNSTHETIVEWCKKARIYIADEVEFWDAEHKISGRVDLFYYHPTRGRIIGAEIKSIADYHGRKGIVFALKGESIAPKTEHVLQAAIYLSFFKAQNIHEWKLLYIARDTGERSEFTLHLGEDDEVLIDGMKSGVKPQMIFDRFKELDDYLAKKELPPRDYELQYPMPKLRKMLAEGTLSKTDSEAVARGKHIKKGDWQCSYCPFKSECWNLNQEPSIEDML